VDDLFRQYIHGYFALTANEPQTMTTLTGKLIRVDQIDVPPEYEREESLISEEDALYRSIEANGVLDHINVLALSNGRYGLIKGLRRIEISKALGLNTIPAVIDQLPTGVEPREYQDRLRFILDEHAQDLFPSQRAALIKQLMSMFSMRQKDVAEYLGVDPGSITLWLKIDNYAPQIVKLIDTGEINLHQARSFDDMKPESQPKVYRKLKREFQTLPGRKLHRLVRSKFRNADVWQTRLRQGSGVVRPASQAKKRRRPKLTRNEKAILAKDLSLKEIELEDGKEELQRLNREITLATPVVRAIMRDEELVLMLPAEVKP
jgi:ParB/RepB/Spo0J family partition protein